MSRQFTDSPAVRAATPLLLGLVGPSGSGKTYSALRLATGIQSVMGGDIGFIDTEANRALHYAEEFKFRHLPFGAPFSPLDYLSAIEYFVAKGCRNIVIDSMSHEHEGPGGVLEMHEQELDRMAGDDWKKRERMTMLAWAKPKAQRRRLINTLLQINANFIFCFRAKEKIKMVRGKEPEQLGWMPIAGEEFVYECTANFLLLPRSGGVPTWNSDFIGERATMKLPKAFAPMFNEPRPLDENMGAAMARWAAGAPVTDQKKEPEVTPQDKDEWIKIIANSPNLASLRDNFRRAWNWGKDPLDEEAQKAIKAEYDKQLKRFT